MLAGDEATSWTDAGPCPACGDTDCWLGCPEAEPADDPTVAIDASDIEIGDRINGHVVYDIAASTTEADHLVVAVALNGASSAYLFDRNTQVEVER